MVAQYSAKFNRRRVKNRAGKAARADFFFFTPGAHTTPTVSRMFAKTRFSPVEIASRTFGSQQAP